MMQNQTPPAATVQWYVPRTTNHQASIVDEATGKTIAVAYDKADAPLLAAAPDGLAFARSFLEWAERLRGIGRTLPGMEAREREAWEVVTKATGNA